MSVDLISGHCSDQDAVCQWLCDRIAGSNRDSRAIAVFDIDDTLLFWDNDRQVIPNMPVYQLFQKCMDLGVYVHIVTARPTRGRKQTLSDLASIGIYPRTNARRGFAALHMMPDAFGSSHVPQWKHATRWHAWMTHRGIDDKCRLLFSVGDQWWDLLGSDKLIEDAESMYGSTGDNSKSTFLLLHPPELEPSELLVKLPSK